MYLKKKDIPDKLATSEEIIGEWKMKVLASNSVSSATSSKRKWNSTDELVIREAFSEFKKNLPRKAWLSTLSKEIRNYQKSWKEMDL